MTTDRSLAAKPRSAVQTSPGRGLIEEIQDFLFHFAGSRDIEDVLIRQLDDFGDPAPNFCGGFAAPFPELFVELLN